MKKVFMVAVVVALLTPVLAWSTTPYTSSYKDGKYAGTINSVVPELNGQKINAEVKHVGDNVEITVTYKDGKEVWTVNDKSLLQKEIDLKTGAVAQQYGATAKTTATANAQTFNINCTGTTCDAGSSPKNMWTLTTKPNGFEYKVVGTPKDKPTEEAKQRHLFTFTMTN